MSNPIPKWRDTTSYSQGRDRKPTCWSIDFGGFHLTVLTGHLYDPDSWVVHCGPWFSAHRIGPKSIAPETARKMAFELIERKLNAATDALIAASKSGGSDE